MISLKELSVEIINPKEKNPNYVLKKGTYRIYDHSFKNFVINLRSLEAELSWPKSRLSCLTLPILCFSIKMDAHCKIVINTTDSTNTKKSFIFSPSFKQLSTIKNWVRIPANRHVIRKWIDLCLDLNYITSLFSPGTSLKKIDSISINSICSLRKVISSSCTPEQNSLSNNLVIHTKQFIVLRDKMPYKLNRPCTVIRCNHLQLFNLPRVVSKLGTEREDEEIAESIHELSDDSFEHRYFSSRAPNTVEPCPQFYTDAIQKAIQVRNTSPPIKVYPTYNSEASVDLVYDPEKKCYLDPHTNEQFFFNNLIN